MSTVTSLPARQAFTFPRTAGQAVRLTSAEPVPGLGSQELRFTVADEEGESADPFIQKTTAAGLTVVDESTIDVTFDPEDSEDQTADQDYYWSLWRTDVRQCLARGTCRFPPTTDVVID